jgi:hypothetical protein
MSFFGFLEQRGTEGQCEASLEEARRPAPWAQGPTTNARFVWLTRIANQEDS